MAFDFGSLDANLAAAAGDDPALLAELRRGFAESVERQIDLLGRARCDGNWQLAALRLHGLGASFHDDRLMQLAEDALNGAPGEPRVITSLAAHLAEIGGNSRG